MFTARAPRACALLSRRHRRRRILRGARLLCRPRRLRSLRRRDDHAAVADATRRLRRRRPIGVRHARHATGGALRVALRGAVAVADDGRGRGRGANRDDGVRRSVRLLGRRERGNLLLLGGGRRGGGSSSSLNSFASFAFLSSNSGSFGLRASLGTYANPVDSSMDAMDPGSRLCGVAFRADRRTGVSTFSPQSRESRVRGDARTGVTITTEPESGVETSPVDDAVFAADAGVEGSCFAAGTLKARRRQSLASRRRGLASPRRRLPPRARRTPSSRRGLRAPRRVLRWVRRVA